MPSGMLYELPTSKLSNCKISKTYVIQYYKINQYFEYFTWTKKHFDFMNSQRESPNKLLSDQPMVSLFLFAINLLRM